MLSKEEIENRSTIQIMNNMPKAQSKFKIGKERTLEIELDIKFNKLQKYMWKKFFNIEVEDVE